MTASEKVWEIPEPVAIHEVRMDDGTVIVLRRHGNAAGPRLVLCHGNGLAIDLYYPFWSLLTEEFDLIIHDLRNHGWNAVGSPNVHNLPTFVQDHDRILEAIDRRFGEKPKIGVFHSISALTSLLSPTHGREFSARILFDPPVCKPDEYPEEFDVATRRCAEMTQRRTEWFESIAECADFLRYIPAFSRVVHGTLELYASSTLRECENGPGYELRCPRDYEAQVIHHARAFAVMVDFERFCCPTKVIGADPILPYSFLPTFDLGDILHVDYDFLPEATHLLQLEQPEECVRVMRDFLESHHLLPR
ncbi:MAG: alpha/beta hydrolase [Gammaproteobacteria bacterium]|nr:alpha/beta hydrolase [Gammaproteobacteria bacterium]